MTTVANNLYSVMIKQQIIFKATRFTTKYTRIVALPAPPALSQIHGVLNLRDEALSMFAVWLVPRFHTSFQNVVGCLFLPPLWFF